MRVDGVKKTIKQSTTCIYYCCLYGKAD